MKIVFVTGPSATGKTHFILSKMEELHKIDPLSYLFVGPGGDYVKQIRELFLKRTGTIVASKFLALDQFAVGIMRLLRPEMLHIGNDVLRMEIGRVLEELDRKELARSGTFIEYLLDMIHDVKENEGFDSIFGEDDEMILLMKSVYEKLQERLKKRMIFDTFDAYLYCKELADEIKPHEFGNNLFLDGFHDFTPAMKSFIVSGAKSFETVYITASEDSRRKELFSETHSIFEFVDKLTPENELHRIYLKEPHYPENVSVFFHDLFAPVKQGNACCSSVEIEEYPDKFSEVENTARNIKRLIRKGYNPEDIAVVASDFAEYEELMAGKFDDYGIPFRSEGDELLTNSRAVRALMLPLETAVSRFPPATLLAMGEPGYAGREIDARYLESVAVSARLVYDFPRTSFNSRKKSWGEKLERYEIFLRRKLAALSAAREDEIEESSISFYQESLIRLEEDVRPAIERIFRSLEVFKGESKKDCHIYGGLFKEWEKQLEMYDSYKQLRERFGNERELIALDTFFQEIIPELERLLLFLEKDHVSPEEYYSYLNLLVRNRSFKISKAVANKVEIQSLLNSRFSTKKVKFFMGFNDESYPAVKLNPLYSFSQYSEKTPKDLLLTKEKQQKLNLYLAITRTTDRLIFSYPSATLDGEILLPSPYLDDILGSSGSVVNVVGSRDGRKGGIIPKPETAMSKSELKISLARYYNTEFWPELLEKYGTHGLGRLDSRLREFSKEPSWYIRKEEFVEKSVGRTFSFSRLKVYDECPFRFYLSYILKLEEKEDLLFEIPPLEEGTIFHSVLKDYFSRFEPAWEKSLDSNLKKYVKHDSMVIYNFEYKRLLEILKEYVEVREASVPKYMTGEPIPTYFEIPFGMDNSGRVEVIEDIYLRGKIDRIDLDNETGKMFIIDYKRGSTSDKRQLVLYSIAANALFSNRGHFVGGGTFRPLTGSKMSASNFKVEEVDGENVWKFYKSQEIRRSGLDEWIRTLTDSLFKGDFTPAVLREKSNCFFCQFKRLCSVATWQAKGVDTSD